MAKHVPASTAPPGEKGKRDRVILLVEDDVLVRLGTEAVLSQLGYRVISAENGVQALKSLLNDETVDALATDYAMPEMSGAELVRAARRHRPNLPALLMTGYADLPEGIEDAVVLQKPFSPGELAADLSRIMRNSGDRA